MTFKAKCEKCGVEIMAVTAERYGGLCAPCGTGRKRKSMPRAEELKPGRRLDWMCIGILLDKETTYYADYFFETGVWDKDPRFKSRSMKVGTNRGLLRLFKATGDLELLQPMPEDVHEQIVSRVASKLKQHWAAGEIPKATAYQCG